MHVHYDPIDAKILKFIDMWKTFEIILQNVNSGYSLNEFYQ